MEIPGPKELVASTPDLASLPDVYLRLRKIIDDPDSSMAEVTGVISSDPALCARLLRITNSAFFGFTSKIETISRSINIIGSQQLHDLVLATVVMSKFNGITSEVMDMRTFWNNSIYCGVVSRLLAIRCHMLDSERLFVEGLLRDIGHQVIYMGLPGLAQEAHERAYQENIEIFRAERELMGFDYAQIGAILMNNWQLPVALQVSVRHHPEPSKTQDFLLEASIVHIASLITTALKSQESVHYWMQRIEPVAWKVTGLTWEQIEPVIKEAEQHVSEMTGLILN